MDSTTVEAPAPKAPPARSATATVNPDDAFAALWQTLLGFVALTAFTIAALYGINYFLGGNTLG